MREEGGQRHLSLLKPHFSFSHDLSKAMAAALSVHARLPPQSSPCIRAQAVSPRYHTVGIGNNFWSAYYVPGTVWGKITAAPKKLRSLFSRRPES